MVMVVMKVTEILMKTTSLESQGNGPIHHLHVDLAELVLEELAAGRHHHLVHVDVVVLEVSKEVRPGGLEDERDEKDRKDRKEDKDKDRKEDKDISTSQTISRSTRPDWSLSCCSCSHSTRLWSCSKAANCD